MRSKASDYRSRESLPTDKLRKVAALYFLLGSALFLYLYLFSLPGTRSLSRAPISRSS